MVAFGWALVAAAFLGRVDLAVAVLIMGRDLWYTAEHEARHHHECGILQYMRLTTVKSCETLQYTSLITITYCGTLQYMRLATTTSYGTLQYMRLATVTSCAAQKPIVWPSRFAPSDRWSDKRPV